MIDYPYPTDEFDQPAAEGQSVGIHRAPRSLWSKLWPFLAVVAGFALLALVLVWWFANQGGDDDGPGASPTQTVTATEDPGESESEEPTDEATEEPTDEPTEEPEPELDRAVAVRVLNATQTSGLAARGVEELDAAGWTNVSGDNYTGGAVSATVVWYQDEQYEAEAQQIAEDLGVTSVELVPALRGPVSVILAGDFAG